MRKFIYLSVITFGIAIGFVSYAYHPKITNIVCNDFDGFRRVEGGQTLNWKVDTVRITVMNDKFGFTPYSQYMGVYLVDSTASQSMFKNSLMQDATLEANNVLSIVVPTPQSNVGLLSLKVDMVSGGANLATWEYAGGDGNGILKGVCSIPNAPNFYEIWKTGYFKIF